ncbi:MAG TPA: carbohydrate-binding family 9-like protein [Polyangiaceae bacterium]
MISRNLSWALSFTLLTACVGSPTTSTTTDDKPHDAKAAAERLKAFILDAPPDDVGTRLDVDFDGKLKLLGARVEAPSPAKAGDHVKVTMYWQTQKNNGNGWKMFTHVVNGAGERVLNIDNVGPLREVRDGMQSLPPGDWEVGKTYVDEQVFTIPSKAKTDKLQILTGVFREHGERMKIVSGPHDTTNRAIVATVPLNGHPSTKGGHVPSLRVDKLDSTVKIKLDGKLDEPAWQSAATTGPLVDVGTGEVNKTSKVNGDVKVLWSEEGMYVGFSVADTDIIGGFKKDEKDPHLWTKDTVEIMVDPEGDGDNKDYYEIQINPQNLVFDSQFDDYNQPKVEPNGPFGHQEWSANLKSAVTLDGTLDKSDDEDRGYTVEAFIPWKSFSKAKKLPPELGSTWRINFYAMKNNGGVAWSPILGQGNFHRAPRFGRVEWMKKGMPEPTPSASGSAAPASSGAPAGSAAPVSSGAPAASVKPAPKLVAPPASSK